MARVIAAGVQALVALMVLVSVGACQGGDTTSAPLDTSPVATAEGPPPPPEGSFLGQIPPDQTSQLTSLGVEVVVPGQVPPSFAIAELRVNSSDPSPGYLVVYQNALNQCFAVEFAAEGTDAPPATENRIPIQPPLFSGQGYHLNYGPFADANIKAQFPASNLFTDWMAGRSGVYRLIGATYIGELFEPLRGCQDISPEEAVVLAESLTVLTGDPMDGALLPDKTP